MMNPQEAIVSFLDAMQAAGVEPAEPINNALASGEFVRFRCADEKKANGWAKLFLDKRPAGRFGNHRLAIDATWKADAAPVKRTDEERAAWRTKCDAERVRRDLETAEKHEAAAAQATALLATSVPADPTHPYLVRKRVSGEGIRQAGDTLLIPMQDVAGRAWNVQRIYPDGTKLFLKGGRVDGLFWLVGDGDGPLCIGEGVGTMGAVRRATGHDVAAAFSAANLEPVARALRVRWPDRPMVICADDDAHLIANPRIARNLGIDAARAAAAAIGAGVALPPRSLANG